MSSEGMGYLRFDCIGIISSPYFCTSSEYCDNIFTKNSSRILVTIQSALVIRTMFVPLCFSERNVLIASGTYECSYSQRNYLVFWKSVPMADVLIARVSYNVFITRVLITRVRVY